MTEAEYQHECSRAELLGLPKPSWDEFLAKNKTSDAIKTDDDDEICVEEPQDVDSRKETFGRVAGGLDELNSILSSTQKKLNRFKTVCGSFSNLLKLHIGSKESGATGSESGTVQNSSDESVSMEEKDNTKQITLDSSQNYVKKDKNSELDKLDSLISKAEKAELSLSSQNKQMRRFLN